jgi:Methyltransferase small domain
VSDLQKVLSSLPWRLTRLRYAEYFKSFNPLAIGAAPWLDRCEHLPVDLTAIVPLLLWGGSVERSAVEEVLGDLVDCLLDFCLLVERDGMLSTPGLSLVQVQGYWLFVSRPRANSLVYLGDDSIGMFWRQSVRPQGSCLDLCTGPGLQALAASALATHVDAVEVNPVSMAIADINVNMNGCGDRVSVHLGSLYSPVQGRVYDSVLANPPFLPMPDSVAYPFVGHGGDDGLRIIREILAGLPHALAADGVAQVICALPTAGNRLVVGVYEELEDWCRQTDFDLLVTFICQIPMQRGGEFFEGLVATGIAAYGGSEAEIRDELEGAYRKAGGSHLATCFLHATRGAKRLRVRDLSHERAGLWFI